MYSSGARWPIEQNLGTFGLLPMDGPAVRYLCSQIPLHLPRTGNSITQCAITGPSQARSPGSPDLSGHPSRMAGSSTSPAAPAVATTLALPHPTGGAGHSPINLSTEREFRYSLHDHTMIISRADLASLGLELGDAASRQLILDLVPIRLGCRYTNTHWRATSADGFCGLHALLPLKRLLPPTSKQKPDLPALISLIQEDLLTLSSS